MCRRIYQRTQDYDISIDVLPCQVAFLDDWDFQPEKADTPPLKRDVSARTNVRKSVNNSFVSELQLRCMFIEMGKSHGLKDAELVVSRLNWTYPKYIRIDNELWALEEPSS